MKLFQRWNNLIGWGVFVISAMVYLLTMEPVASLWDCSEFIATSYKLEVGHPPGAPLFMMLARLATLFAGGNPEYVALTVNAMNSLASAFCILFLFWTITHLARRMVMRNGRELSTRNIVTILGAGAVGALAYTFTDTFWFSAIEGEVYALSSMFTALVFWLMLKWEDHADEPHAVRWIVLIAYLMGLSIGVHILNLLTIPALAFIYYFRKAERVTYRGAAVALLVGCAILLFINNLIIPFTVWCGVMFDIFFVNELSLPVNSGMVFFALSLIGGLAFLTWHFHRRGKALLNTFCLAVTMILIGYSSYASVTIRAMANPPMNSNNPDDPAALLSFLNRDQYGDKPLFYGSYYSAPSAMAEPKYKTQIYLNEAGKYDVSSVFAGYDYDSQFKHFFPRMWDQRRAANFKQWGAYRTKQEVVKDEDGNVRRDQNGRPLVQTVLDFGQPISYLNEYTDKYESVVEPTFGENLFFFFNYQFNYMYWRYFWWNFVGRQSDIQAYRSTLTDGNWLSGVEWIDRNFVGPQDRLPREVAENKGRNTYYFLPLLLGLMGLFYMMNRDPRNFSVVMMLFLMTGVALVFYFNTQPNEPRERDYVFAGSFYAFSVWIGFGVFAVRALFDSLLRRKKLVSAVAAIAISLSVPSILAAQNWDDHDRSNRYFARDWGWNYLQSCLPNSIILNFGDNDTFPLWNNQEVYGVRPDVRILNTSYLGGEWYIEEMKVRSNESDAVPFSLPRSKYKNETNGYLPVKEVVETAAVKDVIEFIRSEHPSTKLQLGDGEQIDYMPTKRMALPVNKENCIASGIVKEADRDKMVDTLYITLRKSGVEKSQMMILDLLANFDWKRPICTTQPFIFQDLGLLDYLQFDGFAYRFVPIRTPARNEFEIGRVDPDYMIPLLKNTFRYGNLADSDVYVDSFIQYNLRAAHAREAFARGAKELLFRAMQEDADSEAKTKLVDEAVELLDMGLERLPISQIRFTPTNTSPFIDCYYWAAKLGAEGAEQKANELADKYFESIVEYLSYYKSFPQGMRESVADLYDEKLGEFSSLYALMLDAKREDMLQKFEDCIWKDSVLAREYADIFSYVARELYFRERVALIVPMWMRVEQYLAQDGLNFDEAYTLADSYYMASFVGAEGAVQRGDALMKAYYTPVIELINDSSKPIDDAALDAYIEQLYQLYAVAVDARRGEIIEELNNFFRSCGTPEDELIHLDQLK